jgi:hypothetical protein
MQERLDASVADHIDPTKVGAIYRCMQSMRELGAKRDLVRHIRTPKTSAASTLIREKKATDV